ncbi:MAG TPA: hypothetical protein VE961_10810 [Pyrinomonadaceae bacterium]|nr:hypothetical protein [Pyrinomonadaceae bacterium]
MKVVKQVMGLALMTLALSVGALGPMSAFGQKNDNRPPKNAEKVKQPDKEPRGNSNNQSNSNKHGRS